MEKKVNTDPQKNLKNMCLPSKVGRNDMTENIHMMLIICVLVYHLVSFKQIQGGHLQYEDRSALWRHYGGGSILTRTNWSVFVLKDNFPQMIFTLSTESIQFSSVQ